MQNMKQIVALCLISLHEIPQRWGTTLVTIFGITSVVGVLLSMLSVGSSVRSLVVSNIHDDRVYVSSNAGQVVGLAGNLTPSASLIIKDTAGIARDTNSKGLASGIVSVYVEGVRKLDDAPVNMTLVAVEPQYFRMFPETHLIAGRMFRPAVRELIVSKSAHSEFKDLGIGDHISLRGSDWTVSGIYEGGSGTAQFGLLADATTVMAAFNMKNYMWIAAQLTSASTLKPFSDALKANPAVDVKVETEQQMKENQSGTLTGLIDFISYFVGTVMAIGATLGALNAMYILVDERKRELATLRAIGFKGLPIVASSLIYALLLAIPAALLGATIAWVLFNGHHVAPLGTGIDLVITARLAVIGIAWAVVIGALGGFFPALRAARLPITDALRAN